MVGEDPVADAQRFERTEGGVVLITRAMLERLARLHAPATIREESED